MRFGPKTSYKDVSTSRQSADTSFHLYGHEKGLHAQWSTIYTLSLEPTERVGMLHNYDCAIVKAPNRLSDAVWVASSRCLVIDGTQWATCGLNEHRVQNIR